MQPASNPGSPPPSPPLISPVGQSTTLDPNWQATKPTVRERNAAMFNNDLMADIRYRYHTIYLMQPMIVI